MALAKSSVEDPRRVEMLWPASATPIEAQVFTRSPECSVRLRECDTGYLCPVCPFEHVLVTHLCWFRDISRMIATVLFLRSTI